jgi:hypothetical protein
MIKVMSNKKRRSIDTKEKHFRKILMKEIFKERKNEQRNPLSIYQGVRGMFSEFISTRTAVTSP